MTSAVKHQGSMKASQISLLIALFSFIEQTIAQREVCPSWIIADNRSSARCFNDTVVCCGTLLILVTV